MVEKSQIRLSIFPGWPPYLNFLPPGEEYHTNIKLDWMVWWLPSASSPLVTEAIQKIGCTMKHCDNRDWTDKEGPAWDHLLVSEKSNPLDFSTCRPSLKINKFPESSTLCRKDKLWINYSWLREQFGTQRFNFLPKTYNLPQDARLLKSAMRKKKSIFIVKPPTGSCGYGIKLVKDFKDVPERKSVVSVQRYIPNPLLINNLKFDLRMYVLMTSVDPLTVYLYEDGLARFATKPYSTLPEDFNDKFIHLTNYSVNKNNKEFEYNENHEDFSGHKWSLKTLWTYLQERGVDTENIIKRIEWLTIKTILCGHFDMCEAYNEQVKYNGMCYKLFGMDVLIDENHKPWLIELNNFPSLEPLKLDRHVNEPMVCELLNIVGFNITSKPSQESLKQMKQLFKMKSNELVWNPGLSSRSKSKFQQKKEDLFTAEDVQQENYLEKLSNTENMTGMDVRILVKAEEELNQCKGFKRIFPREDGFKYLDMLEIQSYSDRLLHAWENKFASKREVGRNKLRKLCELGVHLDDIEEPLQQ